MKILVVGLGYVGCPLTHELAKHFDVVGFDINEKRVERLRQGYDDTNELTSEQVKDAKWHLTTNAHQLRDADVIIVTVPTPVTEANVPDLSPVRSATRMIGEHMKEGALVIYESTVYPGVTEEVCIGILEQASKLNYSAGQFHVGYSPERINPGDKVNTLTTTTKIVSGDTPETLDIVDSIYSKITKTYRAATIKVAEAAKVIENTQRDVNIALMNELTQIFHRLGVDTNDVIDAAGSKWNFLKFRPGLVGGHCISVDPYYLSHKAEQHGFIADVILSAREINDSMAKFIGSETLRLMSVNGLMSSDARVTVLGCTFKEDVPDIRNSKVFDIIKHLKTWGLCARVVDNHADRDEVQHEYNVRLSQPSLAEDAVAIIYAVPHAETVSWEHVMGFAKKDSKIIVIDVKGVLDRSTQPANVILWRP